MHVAILGNGITGATAALRLRELRPDWRITMISGESTYPYSRPALMYIYMGHMGYKETKLKEDFVWADARIELVRGWVSRIDHEAKRLELVGAGELSYDKLLIATGAKPNRFGWPGQDLGGVQGFYSLMDLKQLIDNSVGAEHGVVVGGGLIGIEMAEMLHSRGIAATLLVREKGYWSNVLPREESELVRLEIEGAGIGLELETELDEILDDGKGRAGAVRTKDGRELACQIVGLTAGVSPNVAVVKASGIACGRGVLVDRALRAKVPGVWAAGDCAEVETEGEERNLIQQVWYTGEAQGRAAAASLAGETVDYEPAFWFNSAKFVDLEYQTYGSVPADGENSLVAQTNGPVSGRLLRLVHDDGRLVGVNAMGIRLRHLVLQAWIEQGRDVHYAIDHLQEAAFDPEFYEPLTERFVPELRRQAAALEQQPATAQGGAR